MNGRVNSFNDFRITIKRDYNNTEIVKHNIEIKPKTNMVLTS